MQPWMIIAGLMGLGVLTLLFAPRMHRRSVQKARTEAINHRTQKASDLRQSATAADYPMPSTPEAMRVRDALLLQGVRSAVVETDGRSVLIADESSAEAVASLLARDGRGEAP